MALTLRMWAAHEDTETKINELAAAHKLTGAAMAELLAADPALAFSIESERETCDRADRIGADEYRATVRGIVEDLQRAVRDGEVTDRDGAETWLHETIDGHHDVIYTYAARNVVNQSENGDAYFDAGFGDSSDFDGGIPWSKLAYCALEADVRDAIEDLDSWFKCSDCGGDVGAADLQATEGDNLPTCASCREAEDGRCATCGAAEDLGTLADGTIVCQACAATNDDARADRAEGGN